jgi:hypothetical protein
VTVSIVPRPAPDGAPPARPSRAIDRRTGQTIHLVPSATRPNLFHLVGTDRCDCLGFRATGRCRHLREVQAEQPAAPLPCASCHNYHRTDAERLKAHPDAALRDGGRAHLAVKRMAGVWPS